MRNALNILGEDDYLIVAGDNVFSFSLKDFVDNFSGKTLIAVYDVGDFELAKRYGVVVLEKDRVIDFEEKPANPKSTLISTGVYLFPRDVMKLLNEYLEDGNKDSPATSSSGSLREGGDKGLQVRWLLVRHRFRG